MPKRILFYFSEFEFNLYKDSGLTKRDLKAVMMQCINDRCLEKEIKNKNV